MQAHEARQRPGRLLALDVGVVLGFLDPLVVGLVADVALQHILDEAFLDGLPHGVALAAPRRVFHQIVMADALADLLVDIQMKEPRQQIEQAVAA